MPCTCNPQVCGYHRTGEATRHACVCPSQDDLTELVLSFHPVDPKRSNSGRQAQQPAPLPAESSHWPVHNLSEGDTSHSGNQGNSCQVGACEIKRLRHSKGNNGAKRQLPERASLDSQIANRGQIPRFYKELHNKSNNPINKLPGRHVSRPINT